MAVPTSTATERLVQSRALLREAMQKTPSKQTSPGARNPLSGWLNSLKSIPVVTVLAEALGSWWTAHPLRVASHMAVDTTRALVLPLARRHPLGLALGALALGGLVVWARPWRWILKPALFAGLWSQLLSKGIAHLPLESWLAALFTEPRPKPAPKTPDSGN